MGRVILPVYIKNIHAEERYWPFIFALNWIIFEYLSDCILRCEQVNNHEYKLLLYTVTPLRDDLEYKRMAYNTKTIAYWVE